MELTYFSAPIVKSEKDPETGHLTVYGKLAGPDLDLDGQICDPGWLGKAVPDWFTTGANIRIGHSSTAVGKGLELEQQGADWWLKSKIVDRDAIMKIEEEVLTSYSIGIKGCRAIKDSQAPGGRIVGGQIVESSVVDRPCNPTTKFVLAKSVGADVVPAAEWAPPDDYGNKAVDPEVVKRDFSDKERADLADKGEAMPGGGFPIPDVAALKDAIQAVGLAKNPAAAKTHIKKRAAALGRDDLIPDAWKTADPDVTKGNDDEWTHDPAALAQVRDGLARLMQAELDELMKGESETWDLEQLLCSLQTFLCWWCDESYEGEVPAPEASLTDQGDVDMDLTALGVSPDTIKAAKADDATDEAKAAPLAELKKALGLEDVVTKAAIADAVKEALGDVPAALAAVKEDLDTVKQMAAPGGAIRTRTQQEATKAAERDQLEAERDRYLQMANEVNDKDLAQGYRSKAVEAQKQLQAL